MKKQTMQFECNEDFSKMSATACGRYCDVCQREVIDFRNVPKKQLEVLRDKDVCGIFLPEQVEDGITPIKLPKVRYVAASFLTFLGMEVYAQPESINQKVVSTEIRMDDTTQVATTQTVDSQQPEADALTKKEIRRIQRNSVYNKHAFLRTGRAAYYWSKRFPFIVRRRAYRGGKF